MFHHILVHKKDDTAEIDLNETYCLPYAHLEF